MRYLKLFGVLLIFILGVTIALSLVLPTKQKIERTTTIKAPASSVYAQLSRLEKFNTWAIWNQRDSTMKITLSGTDGQPGVSGVWYGDPKISGEGKIVLRELEPNKRIVYDISFIKPKKGAAESVFLLDEMNGVTSVTWEFIVATPRPWNILNLFNSKEQDLGKDFEEGLASLKLSVEGSQPADLTMPVKTFEVKQMNFPATTYAMIRQQIQWPDINAFYAQHLPIVYAEAGKEGVSPGTATGLIYEWNEKTRQTDIAAALPIPEGSKIGSSLINIEYIPASKAVFADHYGSYDKLREAHAAIESYLIANKFTSKVPVIEQYITDPGVEKDTAKWLTKIIYLVK